MDLGELALTTIVNHWDGGEITEAMKVGLETKCELLFSELTGSNPSPAVRLATQAVIFAWVEHWITSCGVAIRNLQTSDIRLRRQNGAQQRFIRALKTYSQIAALDRFVSGK